MRGHAFFAATFSVSTTECPMRLFSKSPASGLGWIKPLICALVAFGAEAPPVHAAWHPAIGGTATEVAPPIDTVNSSARNRVFYVGQNIEFSLCRDRYSQQRQVLTRRYEVRDYYGTLVASGEVHSAAKDKAKNGTSADVSISPLAPGWYKIAFLGQMDRSGGGSGFTAGPWGFVTGGTTFCVFRPDPHFPTLPAPDAPGTDSMSGNDEVARGALAMGPQRHPITATLPHQPERFDVPAILQSVGKDVALDRNYYLGQWQDPMRPRALLGHFSNGVAGFNSSNPDYAGVSQIVSALKDDVKVWEPRNEPQYGGASGGADFARNEFKPLRDAIKAADPDAQVLAANTVGIRAGDLNWLSGFMQAGGDHMMDGFSFHAYNVVNGDLALGRRSLDGLQAFLTRYGLQDVDKWQTEQGVMTAAYGVFKPRFQGRETMMQRMLFEQYNIPKEHDVMWYDRAHGFWNVPVWWENPDSGLTPAAPLMRVYSEEVWGKKWLSSVDFGPSGNNATIGNVFTGGLMVLMSAGNTQGEVQLLNGGGVSVTDAWGNPVVLSSEGGLTTIPVSELPVYVHGASASQVVKPDWGPNLVRLPGTTVSSNGVSADKLCNGQMETWYYTQSGDSVSGPDAPWNAGSTPPSPEHPIAVDVTFPSVKKVRRVVIYATPPWQSQSTLLDYDLQYWDGAGAKWETIEGVHEPENTQKLWTPTVHCVVDSYSSERWIFDHSFPMVSTNKLRLLVRKVTFGGAVNQDEFDNSEFATKGQHRLVLREIEAYEDAPERFVISGQVKDVHGAAPKGLTGVRVALSGTSNATTTTDANGFYRFADLRGGGNYCVVSDMVGQTFLPEKPSVQNLSANATINFYNPNGDGLTGDFFKSADLSNFKISRLTPQFNFDWRYSGPFCSEAGISDAACEATDPTGIGGHDWSGRWTGQMRSLSNGTYTFHTISDDGIRLWVNGTLLVDAFNAGAGRGDSLIQRSATIALEEGKKYDIRLEYLQRNNKSSLKLFWTTPTTPEELVPQRCLFSLGKGTGLRGEYFDNPDLTHLKKTRLDRTVNFDWGGGSPAPLVAPHTFSVRWTGFVQARFSENYTFYTSSDQGLKLWVGDRLILDNWDAGSQREQRSSVVSLRAGVKVPIRIEYFDDTDDANVAFRWSSESQGKEIVPQSQLYPGGGEGLGARYFNDTIFSDLAQQRIDPQVNFDWGLGSPDPAVNADGFSARWTGQIEPWYSETYTFSMLSDERVRLWVDNRLLIDNWTDHTATNNTAPPITLVGGQKYDIKIEYADVRSFACTKLFWQSSSQDKEVVPQSQLYPVFTDSPVANQPPTVSLVDPISGDHFWKGDVIALAATASDPDGNVAKVEFWAGGTKIGEALSAPYEFRWNSAPKGSISLGARSFDNSGASSDSAPVVISVDDQASGPPSGVAAGTGLRGEYFDTEKLTDSKLVRVDPQINFDWHEGSPDPAIALHTFSARWTGQIMAPRTDTYTFHLWVDEGARLWIDGQLIYDQWSYTGKEESSRPISLVAGRKYSFKMEYSQMYGTAKAQLRWGSPTTHRVVVPTSSLYPTPNAQDQATEPTPAKP